MDFQVFINDPHHCPRCDGVGAAIAYDRDIGIIRECFYCTTKIYSPMGQPYSRRLTWAMVGEVKTEVVG